MLDAEAQKQPLVAVDGDGRACAHYFGHQPNDKAIESIHSGLLRNWIVCSESETDFLQTKNAENVL